MGKLPLCSLEDAGREEGLDVGWLARQIDGKNNQVLTASDTVRRIMESVFFSADLQSNK